MKQPGEAVKAGAIVSWKWTSAGTRTVTAADPSSALSSMKIQAYARVSI
jgi:hypothetical protein